MDRELFGSTGLPPLILIQIIPAISGSWVVGMPQEAEWLCHVLVGLELKATMVKLLPDDIFV